MGAVARGVANPFRSKPSCRKKSRERTVIVVTRAEPLAQRARRVIHIQDGRIVS